MLCGGWQVASLLSVSTEAKSVASRTVLALLAYQNLCNAEVLLGRPSADQQLVDRVPIARLSGEALARFTRLCDAIPGGQSAAIAAMRPLASPIDEFLAVTAPRVRGEQMVRLLLANSLQLELVGRVLPDQVSETTTEVIAADAGLWRTIDYAASAVLDALGTNQRAADELSAYARRLLGDATVAGQRLLVREEGLRRALTGQIDPDLIAVTPVLDEMLAASASRLTQLGLSV